MVETPVLYITFARPEYASQSFAAIKKAQPKKLYFYSNKARDEKLDEVARNLEVRSYINQIDWDCEVKTWFRDEYVDVFTSLWGAIDWVFDNEEKAIVIEEDVVASLAFFDYVDKLIDKYADNDKIWMISGNNAAPKYSPEGIQYFISRLADIYGWASWRKVWKSIDRTISYWPEYSKTNHLSKYWNSRIIGSYYRKVGNKLFSNISTYNPWDFIFNNNRRKNNAYCIVPYTNLAKDIGVIGANHQVSQSNPLSIVSYNRKTFEVLQEPINDLPTSYDKKVFYRIKLPGLIVRKIKVLFKL